MPFARLKRGRCAVCFPMIGMMNVDQVSQQYEETLASELINAVSARLQDLV